MKTKTCPQCGREYRKPHNMNVSKYCSRACYKASYHAQAPARFWAKVDKSAGQDGCWLYTGFRKWDGYGWLARWHNGKIRYLTAHRYAWILTYGDPAKGMHILHECDNPPCCNPSHLRLGTHQDNMADAKAKGRTNSGHWSVRKPSLHPHRVRPERKPA
jgi:hypothetical protein